MKQTISKCDCQWRRAIDDELVTCNILSSSNARDARKALKDIIEFNVNLDRFFRNEDRYRPTWTHAPEWANYYTVDMAGSCFWEHMPEYDKSSNSYVVNEKGGKLEEEPLCIHSMDEPVLYVRPEDDHETNDAV